MIDMHMRSVSALGREQRPEHFTARLELTSAARVKAARIQTATWSTDRPPPSLPPPTPHTQRPDIAVRGRGCRQCRMRGDGDWGQVGSRCAAEILRIFFQEAPPARHGEVDLSDGSTFEKPSDESETAQISDCRAPTALTLERSRELGVPIGRVKTELLYFCVL